MAQLATQDLISINRLQKTYLTTRGDTVHALRDINLTIAEREFVTVVGPSGCGKSTLLKILGGLLSKTAGQISLRGTPVDGPRRDIGIIFQTPVLLPWYTVLDNTLLPIQVLGLAREQYVGRARELLRLVGLEGFEHRYPFELSGGMQQRNAITRALIHDPAILLMDEPFGALDAMTRETMNLELLRIWHEAKKTVFFITHSIPEAVFLADRVVVMSARPGTVLREIPVRLPRPRDLDMMGLPEFVEAARTIRHLLSVKGALD
jgi:NitT/TauT family transport system ATP-binding protein